MTVSIKADFNSVTADGLVKATVRRATGPVAAGDRVHVHDPLEAVTRPGVVRSLDEVTGRVLVEVEWSKVVRSPGNRLTGSKPRGSSFGKYGTPQFSNVSFAKPPTFVRRKAPQV